MLVTLSVSHYHDDGGPREAVFMKSSAWWESAASVHSRNRNTQSILYHLYFRVTLFPLFLEIEVSILLIFLFTYFKVIFIFHTLDSFIQRLEVFVFPMWIAVNTKTQIL